MENHFNQTQRVAFPHSEDEKQFEEIVNVLTGLRNSNIFLSPILPLIDKYVFEIILDNMQLDKFTSVVWTLIVTLKFLL